MPTYGAKASQRGFNVQTCADYQLLFSSEWPVLKIERRAAYTVVDMTQDYTIYTHSLGYPPAFWIFVQDPFGSRAIHRNSYSDFFRMDGTDFRYMGATIGSGVYTGTMTIYYYIFRYDITSTFTADIVTTSPDSVAGFDEFGIKVSIEGKAVSSTDLRDFSVHSNSRTPMIHQTGTVTLPDGADPFISVTHNLTYEPMVYVWLKDSNIADGRWELATSNEGTFISSTSSALTIFSEYSGDFAYMIMKDPLLL